MTSPNHNPTLTLSQIYLDPSLDLNPNPLMNTLLYIQINVELRAELILAQRRASVSMFTCR